MSDWRKLALELFPELRTYIRDKETTIYWLFFDLLPIAVAAHKAQNTKKLEVIYRFADWCHKQKDRAPDIWNAAYTAFYEHLVDDEVTLEAIPYWIKPGLFQDMRDEFEKRLERKGKGKFRELLKRYNEANSIDFK